MQRLHKPYRFAKHFRTGKRPLQSSSLAAKCALIGCRLKPDRRCWRTSDRAALQKWGDACLSQEAIAVLPISRNLINRIPVSGGSAAGARRVCLRCVFLILLAGLGGCGTPTVKFSEPR